MKKIFASVLLLIMFAACANAQRGVSMPGTLEGWQISYGPEVFAGEALYEHINGGADLYHEYGFVDLTVVEYEKEKAQIAVEIYSFQQSAFGIFSVVRSRGAQMQMIGHGGVMSDYYSMFWQSNYLVTLTALSEEANHPKVFHELGRAVAGLLPEKRITPALLDELPQKNLVSQSRYHFAGPIAFGNIHPDLLYIVESFRSAALATYRFEGEEQDYEAYLIIFDEDARLKTITPDEQSESNIRITRFEGKPCVIVAEKSIAVTKLKGLLDQ